MDIDARRKTLRDALVDSAERAIAARGLAGLKARELAAEAGCAVGAIYNVVADLDELVLAVSARSLALLGKELARAAEAKPSRARGASEAAIARLVALAVAYVDFAAANKERWRALFEHRMSGGRSVPDWYLTEQQALFAYIEAPLSELRPGASPDAVTLLARTLFSAVHGVVSLGLEEKLGVVPLPILRAQTAELVSAIGRGLAR
jgi:AcrR family transcriptional regulator